MHKQLDEAAKARILAEALPYIRRYHRKTLIVKLGGSVLGDGPDISAIAGDLTLLRMVGIRLVVVHGGGPQIEHHLRRLALPTKFINGLRVTDDATMEVVEMVLGGTINKGLVAAISAAGGKAVGLTGKDGNLIVAKRKPRKGGADYGLVGEVVEIDPTVLVQLDSEFIPVIAPLALSKTGETLNINADEVAAAIAVALDAEALVLLTAEPGVKGSDGRVMAEISPRQATSLVKKGTISAGMIPKVNCALGAVANGVNSCRIIDGSIAHSILIELLTNRGSGTMVAKPKTKANASAKHKMLKS